MSLSRKISEQVRERGPLTVAAFMELALYDSEYGYYARAARRSGRAGDFFTSVDVGPLFGALLAVQIAEMVDLLATPAAAGAVQAFGPAVDGGIDLVEAGAGDGRLAADILDAATRRNPALYDRLRLHLVERSPAARAAQAGTLAEHAAKIASSSDALPGSFEGVLVANELLDALPVHQVVMREDGLREVYVAHPPLRTICGEPSTPRLAAYLDAAGAHLEPGWRAEIGLAAVDWMRDAARRLTRGFVVLVDYGHQARELYSARHSAGTLTTFAAHRADTADENAADAPWLDRPGEQDITAHVDFTSVTRAAESEGMTTIAFLDQTYFVLGLLPALADQVAASPRLRLALQTLVMPGGLGSTMKVLILGKGVGAPALRGCSYRVRAT